MSKKVSEFNDASLPLTGNEFIPIVQNGLNRKTPISEIKGDVESVNGKTGEIVLNADDIDDVNTTNKFATDEQLTQIATNESDISSINTAQGVQDGLISDLRTDVDTNTSDLSALQTQVDEIDIDGIKTYQTLAEFNTVSPVPDNGTSFKIANDPNEDNNGDWSVSGGVPVQNSFVVENVVEESNTSKGVSGKAVFYSELENNYKTPKTKNDGISSVTNRFNKDTILSGFRLYTGDGTLVSDANQNTSDFIQVYDNEKVITLGFNAIISGSRKSWICFYDKNKDFISSNVTFIEGDIVTPPENCYFLRISYYIGADNTFMVLCGFNPYIIPEYIPYNNGDYKTDVNKLNEVITDSSQFFEDETNYFDKTNVVDGFRVNYVYGNLDASATRSTSFYIKVREGFKLTLQGNTGNNSYCWYKNVIEPYFFHQAGANTWDDGEIITVPDGVNYIRFSMNTVDKDNIMLLMGTGVGMSPKILSDYKSYGESTQYLKPEYFNTENLPKLEYTRNAFVVENSIDGFRLDLYSTNLVSSADSTTSLEYVPVVAGDIIYSNLGYSEANFGAVYYDASKNWVGFTLFTKDVKYGTVPENALYIRTYTKTTNKNSKIVNINSTKDTYILGGKYVSADLNIGLDSTFKNMKWVSDGDSITAQQTWQDLVLTKYNLDWQNIGIGGQKYSSNVGFWATSFDETDDIANSITSPNGTYHIPNDVDLVTLMGGVNDFAQSIPLGAQDSTDTDTVLGGLNKYIELFYTNFPTKTLIIMSPTLAYKTSGDFVGYTNNIGLTCYDYADAIKERCKTLGVRFVDIIRDYGINEYNQALYTPDRTHPNKEGGQRISGVLMGYINQIDSFNGGVTPLDLGYDLVVNGTFPNSTGWTLNDWSVASSKASITNSSGSQVLSQDIGIEVGKRYRLKYRIIDYTQGGLTFDLGGFDAITRNSNGTFIDIIEVTNLSSNSLLNITALNTFTGAIDYIIVQEIL